MKPVHMLPEGSQREVQVLRGRRTDPTNRVIDACTLYRTTDQPARGKEDVFNLASS
jgi:hypothetical protein